MVQCVYCKFRKYCSITMQLYFLDDGSLVIAEQNFNKTKVLATTLLFQDDFEIVRNKGQNYLSNLSGQEVFDLLVRESEQSDEDNLSLNGCKSDLEQIGTADKCNK